MKVVAPHLNLLRDSERLSSSPVRLRVMGPVFAMLSCVGCLLWWGILVMQSMVVRSSIASVREDLDSKRAAHAEVLSMMAEVRETEARLGQLEFYRAGRQTYGTFFARLAGVVPEDVQLMSVSIPEPPRQNLSNPLNPKAPPLLGPQDPSEQVSLRMLGRTRKSDAVKALMGKLRDDEFTNVLVRVEDPNAYPRIYAFRQEAATEKGDRLLQFDIEYRCSERRFAK